MASQQTPPKTMSSRLLTMKFMQRAAASPASASSPAPSSPATPQSEGQASKRRKLQQQQQQQSTPDAADIGSLVDSTAVRTALEDEERKRHEAVVRRAAESGDARWVLDVPRAAAGRSSSSSATASGGGGGGGGTSGRPSLNVVSVGFAQIDSQDEPSAQGPSSLDGDPDTFIHPLRRYNMDKKKVKKQPEPQSDDDNDDDDTGSGSDSDSDSAPETGRQSYAPHSTAAASSKAEAAREALTGKRKAENAKAKELADKRRKKDIKLNKTKPKPGGGGGISSISSGGGAGSGPSSSSGGFSCHRCGKPGHKAAACKAAPSFKGAPAAR